jgi:hypothetical protein
MPSREYQNCPSGEEGKRVDAQHQGRGKGRRGKEAEEDLLLYK